MLLSNQEFVLPPPEIAAYSEKNNPISLETSNFLLLGAIQTPSKGSNGSIMTVQSRNLQLHSALQAS
eukprot:IDg18229t1